MARPDSTESRSPKRFFRPKWLLFFALVGLGIFVFGWVGNRFVIKLRQDRLERWVGSYGGTVTYENAGEAPFDLPQSLIPMYQNATSMYVGGSASISDHEIAQLANFPFLRDVQLRVTTFDDRQLAILSAATQIEKLDLSNSGISDFGVVELSGLSNLKELNLTRTDITDDAIAALMKLPNLQVAHVRLTDVSSDGIATLVGRHRSLKQVVIDHSQILDGGIVLRTLNPGINVDFR
ncbi:MAG: hypothetical protein HKN23_21970 [Verrucomicrobiales bacterium]|nr:hypothetical protein [Verrucomicrobiales bacterium]